MTDIHSAKELMLQRVQQYCQLIESAPMLPISDWLRGILELLPQLHSTVAMIQEFELKASQPLKVDFSARFELFSRLHKLLGELDAYWMEFDVAQEGQGKTGSLADDLTDIYCELKYSLRVYEKNQDAEYLLSSWYQGYKQHWGQHLVDAERHLYKLNAQNQLAS